MAEGPAQNGVNYLLSRQIDGAWGYDGKERAWNSMLTMWCIMALKSAKAGALDVRDGMAKTNDWFARIIDQAIRISKITLWRIPHRACHFLWQLAKIYRLRCRF